MDAALAAEKLKQQFVDLWIDEAGYPALMPRNLQDVCGIVHWCRQHQWKVLPVGSGHSFPAGMSLDNGVVTLLSLALTGIDEPDPEDLVVSVEAGATVSRLLEVLDEAGFVLPGINREYKGTVGGLFLGTHGQRYRHLVLGGRFVDGLGHDHHFGGRVRKDVSGFDAIGVLLGSRGRLAWVEKLILRLTPRTSSPVNTVEGSAQTSHQPFQGVQERVAAVFDPDDVFYYAGG